MSCKLCSISPPKQPVLTADGESHCLECVTKWYKDGNKNEKLVQVLIPDKALCQKLNISIPQIPDDYSAVEKKILKRPREEEIENIQIHPIFQENFPECQENISERIYNNFKCDVNKLNIIFNNLYKKDWNPNDIKFLNHEFKFKNTTVYKYTYIPDIKLQKLKKTPIGIIGLMYGSGFKFFKFLSYCVIEQYLYLYEYFNSIITLPFVNNSITVTVGFNTIFKNQEFYTRENLKIITKYELFKLLEIIRPEIDVPVTILRCELIDLIVENPYKIDLQHWIKMYNN